MNLCRFRDNVSLICFQKKLECNHHCLREIVLGVLIISKITTLQSDSEKSLATNLIHFQLNFFLYANHLLYQNTIFTQQCNVV